MKYQKVEEEFQRLNKMEKDIFAAIERQQNTALKQLQQQQQQKREEANRREQIKLKSKQQIVKHPCNNHLWLHLANFIHQQDQIDLSDIAARKKAREHIRSELSARKTPADNPQQLSLQEGDGLKNKTKTPQKVSWKLMRELRRKQVEENKRRLLKIEENKREKMNYYHKY